MSIITEMTIECTNVEIIFYEQKAPLLGIGILD